MQQRLATPEPHTAETALEPELLKKLGAVLHKLHERIAVSASLSPNQRVALTPLVEGLSRSDWQNLMRDNFHGWLALPLDEEEGAPLLTLHETLEELAYQRNHDTLTGLANRWLFNRELQFELGRAYRTATPLSIVMIDIDYFKAVNDTHGYAAGDKVLATLGDLMLNSLPVYDIAARLGGEEFCVILPGTNGHEAVRLTRRLLADFARLPFESPTGVTFSCTFSAGVATAAAYPESSAAELLAQADAYLYDAKSQGKNRVVSRTAEYTIAENPALVLAAEKQFLFTGKQ